MRRTHHRRSFAPLALTLIVGCSSSTNSGGGPGGTPAASTESTTAFIHELAVQTCEWEFRCCTDAEIKTRTGKKYADRAKCIPYSELAYTEQLYVQRLAVKKGRIKLDDGRAAACLAQTKKRACSPKPGTVVPPPDPTVVNPCERVFIGATPIGDECDFQEECVEGARCVVAARSRSGVCIPYQKDGEVCNRSEDCDPRRDELYCSKRDFKCHKRAKVGQACEYTRTPGGEPTLPMLVECDPSKGTVFCDPESNTCKALPLAGEACLKVRGGLGFPECNPDPALRLSCDRVSKTCRGLGKAGEECGAFPCEPTLVCDRSVSPPLCAKPPTKGEPCVGVCEKPYFCNARKFPAVCDESAKLGEPCDMTPCSPDLFCSADRLCIARLADGEACNVSQECLSSICGGLPRVCQPGPVTVVCAGR